MSFDEHIAAVVNKTNRIVGAIRRSFTFLGESNFRLLFKALVRPHLEYAVAVWKLYKRRHINALEKVQRRATKLVPTLKHLLYRDRLQRLLMTTLAFRRLRGDMIETFKIITGKYDTNVSNDLLVLSTNRCTRGHQYKLQTRRCNRNIRLHNFTYRVVAPWNSLPDSVVTAPSVQAFERRLDSHWKDHPLRLDPAAPEI